METQPGGTGVGGQVIWQREIEHDVIARRWRQLLRFYVIPTAVVLLVGLAVGGIGALLGLGILLGLFGVLVVALVFLKNRGARQHPVITRKGDDLVCGPHRVDLRRVESWSTQAKHANWGTASMATTGNPMAGNPITARLMFRLAVLDEHGHRRVRPNGGPAYELISIGWAEMPPDHLDRLRQVVAPHVRAPYVDVERLSI